MRRKPTDRTQLSAVLLSIVLTVSIAGAVAFIPAAAEHPDDAPDYTGDAFFEVSAVSQSDHYPGQSEGSMRYEAGGADAFKQQGAEDGVWIDYIIIDSYYDGEQWIDYTNCNTENTAAFGLDRGNDNEGTNYDEDLVQKQKSVDFRQDGITIEFYNHDDFGGDPPYMAPEDAIVAQQGEGSAGGPCLQYTEEPGWYRIQGFMNGTVADNGQDSAPSDGANQVSVAVESTWFYVCDCESEEEAREKLGPPPGEEGSSSSGGGGSDGDGGSGGESTPASDGESTPTPEASTPGSDGEATATPGGSGSGSGESTPADTGEGNGSGAGETGSSANGSGTGQSNGSGAGTQSQNGNGSAASTANGSGTGNGSGQVDGDEGGDGATTPTANDAPGFGALVAVLALLGSALLLKRRR